MYTNLSQLLKSSILVIYWLALFQGLFGAPPTTSSSGTFGSGPFSGGSGNSAAAGFGGFGASSTTTATRSGTVN